MSLTNRRQRQALAQQHEGDEHVIDQRAIAHHVDERPLIGEAPEARDVGGVDLHVTERHPCEEARDDAELATHRGAVRSFVAERDVVLADRIRSHLRLTHRHAHAGTAAHPRRA